MNKNSLNIKIAKSPDEAPDYNKLDEKHLPLSISEAIIVRNGTIEKRSTVDLILVDDEGKKYMTMTTGRIITALAKIIDEPEN